MTSQRPAVQCLFDNLAALPSTEYGPINLLPFALETEQTRAMKWQVAAAIINLLEDNGFLKPEGRPEELLVNRPVEIACAKCRKTLVQIDTDEHGRSYVTPELFIPSVSGLNPECEHKRIGLDDLRQHMEREFYRQDEELEEQ